MPLGERPDRATDLGDGAWAVFTAWAPDRDLNPQYDGIPDVDRFGLIVAHPAPDGSIHEAGITLEGDVQDRLEPDRPKWKLISADPLHVEPSLLCTVEKGGCGAHGFVRGGRWVSA